MRFPAQAIWCILRPVIVMELWFTLQDAFWDDLCVIQSLLFIKLFLGLYAHWGFCLLLTLLLLSFNLCLETLLTCPICHSTFVMRLHLWHLALSLFHLLNHVLVVSGRRLREELRVILHMLKPFLRGRWFLIIFNWITKGDASLFPLLRFWEDLLCSFYADTWTKCQRWLLWGLFIEIDFRLAF